MSGPLLSIENLTRDYALRGKGGTTRTLRAVDGVSLAVEAGSIVAVVGESGCGKSTLARIVMALDRPTGGTVRLCGDDLFALSPKALARKRRDFQMVFPGPLRLAQPAPLGRPHRRRAAAPPRRRAAGPRPPALVARALEDVGLPAQAAERYPHEFSGGQRQRIAIARALITNPKLVVADEAVSALDLSIQAQILRLILSLRDRHGLTVLFITHNIGVVDEIADRVGVMQAGRLVETGTVREVLDHPRQDYTRTLLAAEPTLAALGQRKRRA